jgi:hypothetical protein
MSQCVLSGEYANRVTQGLSGPWAAWGCQSEIPWIHFVFGIAAISHLSSKIRAMLQIALCQLFNSALWVELIVFSLHLSSRPSPFSNFLLFFVNRTDSSSPFSYFNKSLQKIH